MQHYQAADAQNADISSGFIMLIAGRAAFLRLLSARGRRGFPRPEPVAGGRWPEAGVGVGVNLPEGPPSLWHVGVCRRGEEVTLLFIFFGAAFPLGVQRSLVDTPRIMTLGRQILAGARSVPRFPSLTRSSSDWMGSTHLTHRPPARPRLTASDDRRRPGGRLCFSLILT